MPNANRPSGPGKPEKERRAAAGTREQLDEVELGDAADASSRDPTRSARTAERDAHVSDKGTPGGRAPKR